MADYDFLTQTQRVVTLAEQAVAANELLLPVLRQMPDGRIKDDVMEVLNANLRRVNDELRNAIARGKAEEVLPA